MKIAIYSPYLDSFGGGEKYMMTIAEILSTNNIVDVLLDEHLSQLKGQYLKNELSKRFNLNLKTVNFTRAPIGKNTSAFSRSFFLKSYDLLFYLTDGSIFYPTSKKNILHIQSPLVGQPAKSLWGKFKLKGWDLIIYNSNFTQKYSHKNWPLSSKVIYPPVDVDKIRPLSKKKFILSVGRFFGYLKDKKHNVLINSFEGLYKTKQIKDWSLHIVGSAGQGDESYLSDLKKTAIGLPVKFYPNLGYDDLIKLYGESSIYWHASGFKEDDPTKMEHFGISTVEAMAAGCIPVVVGQGGQLEIVEGNKSGFFWENIKQLKKITLELAENDNLREKIMKKAINRSKKFSTQKFKTEIFQLVNGMK